MILVTQTGRMFLNFVETLGRMTLFAWSGVAHIFRPPFYFRQTFQQFKDIGFYSLPVVGMTALFTGMVLALQTDTGVNRLSAGGSKAVATVVVLSMTRELGPVLGGLMVAGRIGAAMAAEIGTMRVTEQIDALITLSTNPFKYLISPRIFAAISMLPLLVLVADIIGILGGYLVAVNKLDFNGVLYLYDTVEFLEMEDVISGLIKSSVFGFFIALMGCYHGFYSKGGAQGVGTATTHAVVSASILILLTNYFLTALMFHK